jgi:membrane-associated protease RseP (regulator of RpoE activity)
MSTTPRQRRFAALAVALPGLAVLVTLAGTRLEAQVRRTSPLIELHTQITGGSAIGASIRDVDRADVTREKLPTESGAVITEVQADGPAAKAGLKAGDIVTKFDGETVRSARQLTRLVDETPDGREVETTVVRDGQRLTVKITPTAALSPFAELTQLRDLRELTQLTDRLRTFEFQPNIMTPVPEFTFERHELFPFRVESRARARLGAGVQDLTGQLGTYFGASQGALVTTVDDSTPAHAAGLKAGDVITKVNGQAVTNADDLVRRLTAASGDVTLTIVRDKKEQTLTVKLGTPSVGRTIR